MSNSLVSIIVPIYKVEKYIEKCVLSLINQSYKNIEIILVDDGSPDNSGNIIDELASTDSRVKVIHKQNGGVSVARNSGLQLAKGDYIMFVDGDDWVDDSYVSYFVNLVEKNNCSVGMNIRCYTNSYMDSTGQSDNHYYISAEKAMEWIYSGHIFVGVWNKIYHTELLVKNNIRFNPEIWYGEGMLFNIECVQYVDCIAIGEKCVYHQTFNPNSAMRDFNLKSNQCGIKSLDIQKKIWKKTSPEVEAAWEYHRYCFNRSIVLGIIRSNKETQYKDEYKDCVRAIRKGIKIPLKYEIGIKPKLYWLMLALFPKVIAKRSAKNFYERVRNESKQSNNH